MQPKEYLTPTKKLPRFFDFKADKKDEEVNPDRFAITEFQSHLSTEAT